MGSEKVESQERRVDGERALGVGGDIWFAFVVTPGSEAKVVRVRGESGNYYGINTTLNTQHSTLNVKVRGRSPAGWNNSSVEHRNEPLGLKQWIG
jgi:hypothetical protein